MSFPPWANSGLEKLLMKADDISNLPDITVPDGYVLSGDPLQESDHEGMVDCLASAYGIQHDVWDLPRIQKVFIDNKDVKRTFRLLFDNSDGTTTVAGTATLKIMPNDFPGSGYLHWVAVHPRHQGHGLAKILVNAVLREARDFHGATSCVLNVVDTSLPALSTYFKFGFEPVMIEENNAGRWEAIMAELAKGKK